MTDPMLEMKNIRVLFKPSHQPEIVAVENASLSVKANEFVSLIGPSGCGKSTLLRAAAGLEQPASGVILVEGAPVDQPGSDRGMVFQTYTLFPWLSGQGKHPLCLEEINAFSRRKG
jgi:ABC-type nitrate/sulfonate/bicarbonate transport system ATPase subunit